MSARFTVFCEPFSGRAVVIDQQTKARIFESDSLAKCDEYACWQNGLEHQRAYDSFRATTAESRADCDAPCATCKGAPGHVPCPECEMTSTDPDRDGVCGESNPEMPGFSCDLAQGHQGSHSATLTETWARTECPYCGGAKHTAVECPATGRA